MIDVSKFAFPIFRDRKDLTQVQLCDPDYGLKELEKLNNGIFTITCSKCHHCR